MESDVTPDGSPIPVYRALPVEPEFTPLLGYLEVPGSVLDLGCGVGRLANELTQRGFDVTGVDESAEMLAHLRPDVRAVCADIRGLGLGRRFDSVVLASHLVNVADQEVRRLFLQTAADHVTTHGTVLIQHWEPPPAKLEDVETDRAGVRIAFKIVALEDKDLHGRVTYGLGDRSWTQTFRARLLDESDLDSELAQVGLRRSQRLSPKWLVAMAADTACPPTPGR